MTNSLPSRKSVKWGRLILGSAVFVLVIAMALLWFAYKTNPESVGSLYYVARYGIDIGDGGVLSDTPCAAPCILGIRTGKTQFDQVMPTLEKNGIAGSKCITEPNVSWFLFICGAGSLNIQVDKQTNIVNAVWILPNDSIFLGEIIGKYGEPNHVTLDGETPDAIHPRFYWDAIRMSVLLPEIYGSTYDVEKTTEVEGIQFSDENLYRISDKVTEPYYKTWNGYGIYQTPVENKSLTPMPTIAMTPSMSP